LTSARRVVVLTTSFPNMSETFVRDHVTGLVRRGWDVHVLAAVVRRDRLETTSSRNEFTVHEYGDAARGLARTVNLVAGAARSPRTWTSAQLRAAAVYGPNVSRLLTRLEPAVVHAHFGGNGLLARISGARRLIVDFHGQDVLVVPRREGWGPYQRYLRDAVAVVHSGFIESLVKRHLQVPVHLVKLGIDHATFHPKAAGNAWGRPLRLLTLGRLMYQKGHHVAIDAVALLGRSAPALDVRLTIAGSGPELEWLSRRASLLGVEDRVAFVGPLEHASVADAMRSADALLVPSLLVASGWEEAFGRVAIEGLACGLPVIASRLGGLRDTVDGAGLLVEPGSAPALADAIRNMTQNSSPADWRERASARAREFTDDVLADEYDAVTRSALAR
jgi:glycosyltransferase involved in cell wall biosynthesis